MGYFHVGCLRYIANVKYFDADFSLFLGSLAREKEEISRSFSIVRVFCSEFSGGAFRSALELGTNVCPSKIVFWIFLTSY